METAAGWNLPSAADGPFAREIRQLQAILDREGLAGALRFLNRRTPFRFTGVYRFDGDMLRNVALHDRWTPEVRQGPDAPMVETFCAIVGSLGDVLEVADGDADARFPWMKANAVASYCGAPILDADGVPVGSVCHFDTRPCQAPRAELPLLRAAADMIAHEMPA